MEKVRSLYAYLFFFSSRRRHTRCLSDWSSDVCSFDLATPPSAKPPCRPLVSRPARIHLPWDRPARDLCCSSPTLQVHLRCDTRSAVPHFLFLPPRHDCPLSYSRDWQIGSRAW